MYNSEIYDKYKQRKRILLVDDSVDTGNTIKKCENKLSEIFPSSDIVTASYNTMSTSIIYPDYYLYKDTMIRGPWSSDSKKSRQYIKKYNEWKKSYLK